MNKDTGLTSDEQARIENFLWNYTYRIATATFAVTGICGSLFGFMVHQWIYSSAFVEVMKGFQPFIQEISAELGEAKSNAIRATQDAENARKEIEWLRDRLNTLHPEARKPHVIEAEVGEGLKANSEEKPD